MNLEIRPKNTSESMRFVGGAPKIIRNVRDEMDELAQVVARAADLIFFYETELTKIATAKGFDNTEKWAKNTAKQAIKKGKTL